MHYHSFLAQYHNKCLDINWSRLLRSAILLLWYSCFEVTWLLRDNYNSKTFKNKEHNFEWWSILCQVSKGSAVWSEFNIFCTFVTMAMTAILNFFQPLKSCHTLRWIFLQNFMKFDERNQFFFKSPLFLFRWQLRQCLSNGFWFFWLIDVDVDVVPIKFHQFLFGE